MEESHSQRAMREFVSNDVSIPIQEWVTPTGEIGLFALERTGSLYLVILSTSEGHQATCYYPYPTRLSRTAALEDLAIITKVAGAILRPSE